MSRYSSAASMSDLGLSRFSSRSNMSDVGTDSSESGSFHSDGESDIDEPRWHDEDDVLAEVRVVSPTHSHAL